MDARPVGRLARMLAPQSQPLMWRVIGTQDAIGRDALSQRTATVTTIPGRLMRCRDEPTRWVEQQRARVQIMITTGKHVRATAVAGTFYPDDPSILRHTIARLLSEATASGPYPKALIVPHAGLCYSGAVAASGYALVKPIRDRIERVVLIGPSHRVPFYGLAACSVDEFSTPLGTIPLESKAIDVALRLPQVHMLDEAHQFEHSLEIQLPFLQVLLSEFVLAPFVVGSASADEVAEVLEHLWHEDETLIIVSSDLSHYHDYGTARSIDSETAHLIERCQWEQMSDERACGYRGICGLLKTAKAHHLHVHTIDLRNSGDTAGARDQVVGYGSFVVY